MEAARRLPSSTNTLVSGMFQFPFDGLVDRRTDQPDRGPIYSF